MRRRDFIAALGAAAAWPLAARAQQIGQVARVVLWLGGLGPSDPETQRVAAAFRDREFITLLGGALYGRSRHFAAMEHGGRAFRTNGTVLRSGWRFFLLV